LSRITGAQQRERQNTVGDKSSG